MANSNLLRVEVRLNKQEDKNIINFLSKQAYPRASVVKKALQVYVEEANKGEESDKHLLELAKQENKNLEEKLEDATKNFAKREEVLEETIRGLNDQLKFFQNFLANNNSVQPIQTEVSLLNSKNAPANLGKNGVEEQFIEDSTKELFKAEDSKVKDDHNFVEDDSVKEPKMEKTEDGKNNEESNEPDVLGGLMQDIAIF